MRDINMECKQKKGSVKHVFRFENSYVNFSSESKTEGFDIDVNYSGLSKKTGYFIESNVLIKNIGYLWIILGLFLITLSFQTEIVISRVIHYVFIGLLCLAWSHYSKIKYTVLKSDVGNILVIQGKNHDQIVNELMTRRKSQLLDLYGDINPNNEIEIEIEKFNWLVEQEVLSQEDADRKISMARIAQYEDEDYSEDRPN